MIYVPILRLTLAHDYYGDAPAPIAVRPDDASRFDRDGFLLRQRGRQVTVVADEDEACAGAVSLDLVARDPEVFSVTDGADWRKVPRLSIPTGPDTIRFSRTEPALSATQAQARLLARLDIALPPTGTRDLTLAFDAVAALWAYHLTGPRSDEDLQIVDTAGDIGFDDLGLQRLPDGRQAKVLRSSRALPARARPAQKFALERPSPFGPETLIPVLPAAKAQFRIPPDSGAAASLQSDIYVTLW